MLNIILLSVFFLETTFSFGNVVSDSTLSHTFSCVNTANVPITIDAVATSCGCVSAKWTRKPLFPGDSCKIDLSFSPEKYYGFFTETANVYISGEKKPIKLKIVGNILNNSADMEHFIAPDVLIDENSPQIHVDEEVKIIERKGRNKNVTFSISNAGGKNLTVSKIECKVPYSLKKGVLSNNYYLNVGLDFDAIPSDLNSIEIVIYSNSKIGAVKRIYIIIK